MVGHEVVEAVVGNEVVGQAGASEVFQENPAVQIGIQVAVADLKRVVSVAAPDGDVRFVLYIRERQQIVARSREDDDIGILRSTGRGTVQRESVLLLCVVECDQNRV